MCNNKHMFTISVLLTSYMIWFCIPIESTSFKASNENVEAMWPECAKQPKMADQISCMWESLLRLFAKDFLKLETWNLTRSLMGITANLITAGAFQPNEIRIFVDKVHATIVELNHILLITDLYEDVKQNLSRLNTDYHMNRKYSVELLQASLKNISSSEEFWNMMDIALRWLQKQRLNCLSYVNESAFDFPKSLNKESILQSKQYLKPLLLECVRSRQFDPILPPITTGGIDLAIKVSALFAVESLISFSNSGELEVRLYMKILWVDFRRMWVPEQYSGLTYIALSAAEIWHPTFQVARCTSHFCVIRPDNDTNILLHHNGKVIFSYMKRISVSCEMNLWNFPFDKQNCAIKIFSFEHIEISEIDEDLVSSEYITDEWKVGDILIDKDFYYFRSKSSTTPTHYPQVKIQITFERVPNYYIQNLLTPVLVLTLIGIFTVLLPHESAEKLNLSTSVLLGFLFLQTIIASLIPKTAILPNIATYCIFAILLSSYMVIFSSLVLSVGQIPALKNPPRWICFLVIKIFGTLFLFNFKRNVKLVVRFLRRNPSISHWFGKGISFPKSKGSASMCRSEIEFQPVVLANSMISTQRSMQDKKFPATGKAETIEDIPLTELIDSANNKKNEGPEIVHDENDVSQLGEEEYTWTIGGAVINRMGNVVYLALSLYIFFAYLWPILPR